MHPAATTLPDTRAVNRAIGELRRGVPVMILGAAGDWLVALTAETASQATLNEALAVALGSPVLLLAASRAADLQTHAPTGPVMDSPASVAVALAAGGLDVAALRALADPTMPQAPLAPQDAAPKLAPDLQAAAMMLAKLARLLPAVLVARAAVPSPDLLSVLAAAVLVYPMQTAERLVRAAEARVPLEEFEDVRIVAFRPDDGGIEHMAIVLGQPAERDAPLVRIHSECFTGDLLGSRRCDCGPQLHRAIARMAEEGAGVVLYMAQEGRGIGLVNKLRAYTLQDRGLDTLDANQALGYGADERSFVAASTMLRSLGLRRVRLLTNNPVKIEGLTANGIEVVGRLSHVIAANGENDGYLQTKARRFGHLI